MEAQSLVGAQRATRSVSCCEPGRKERVHALLLTVFSNKKPVCWGLTSCQEVAHLRTVFTMSSHHTENSVPQ